jgi:hypothetical protein
MVPRITLAVDFAAFLHPSARPVKAATRLLHLKRAGSHCSARGISKMGANQLGLLLSRSEVFPDIQYHYIAPLVIKNHRVNINTKQPESRILGPTK